VRTAPGFATVSQPAAQQQSGAKACLRGTDGTEPGVLIETEDARVSDNGYLGVAGIDRPIDCILDERAADTVAETIRVDEQVIEHTRAAAVVDDA